MNPSIFGLSDQSKYESANITVVIYIYTFIIISLIFFRSYVSYQRRWIEMNQQLLWDRKIFSKIGAKILHLVRDVFLLFLSHQDFWRWSLKWCHHHRQYYTYQLYQLIYQHEICDQLKSNTYLLSQPLRVELVLIENYPFSRQVTKADMKNLVWPTICPYLGWIDSVIPFRMILAPNETQMTSSTIWPQNVTLSALTDMYDLETFNKCNFSRKFYFISYLFLSSWYIDWSFVILFSECAYVYK